MAKKPLRGQGWLAAAALLPALRHYLWASTAGFPDSHLTDLDGARLALYDIAIPVALGFAAWFLFAAVTRRGGRLAGLAMLPFVLLAAALFGIEFHQDHTLDNGIGG